MERAYKSKKEQLDFISIWQKLIDVNGITAKEMLNMVMKTFLNHFDVDRAVYIAIARGCRRYFTMTQRKR